MVIDLRKMRLSGKDSEDFFFEYNPEKQLTTLPNCKIINPITVTGSVVLTGDHSAVVDGEVCFTISGECTRCLKQTENKYVFEFSESADSEDENAYPVKCDKVDISAMVDDVITLNSPISFLCDENCKGICTGCGVNLNDGKCKCNNK